MFSVFVNDFAIDDGVLYSAGLLDQAAAATGKIGKHHHRTRHNPVVVEDCDICRQTRSQAPSCTDPKVPAQIRPDATTGSDVLSTENAPSPEAGARIVVHFNGSLISAGPLAISIPPWFFISKSTVMMPVLARGFSSFLVTRPVRKVASPTKAGPM
jgi:hypothetical protein